MQENGLNKLRRIVFEVSSIVDNLVSLFTFSQSITYVTYVSRILLLITDLPKIIKFLIFLPLFKSLLWRKNEMSGIKLSIKSEKFIENISIKDYHDHPDPKLIN